MPLEVGGRLGPYEILATLGEGGMGKVYRARDTTLNRDVAVKVLAEPAIADPEWLARFHREAQVLASLNHPHIAAIYGVERYAEGQALVLELVDGPTLADRSVRGPLPVREAIEIARQIAQALEAAHEKNIVHRDLKPANVAFDSSGRVKVLDFGLAKLAEPTPSTNATADVTRALTAASSPGVIVGTAAYMAPEQIRGEATDRLCDVWAFGCVLFETLTGRAAFTGATFSDIIGEVLKSDPDWTALPSDTPAAIRRLLRRCLEKDRRRRLRDIADARLELEDIADASPDSSKAPAGSRRTERLLWASAVVVVAAAAAWVARLPSRDQSAPALRLEITTPPTTDPASLAISPDGRRVVFAGDDDNQSRLWVRALDEPSPTPLAGTEAGYYPFWSPDARSLAFFAVGKLKRIDIDTGSVQTLDDATAGRGGAWLEDGTIIFAPQAGPIYRIPATGGPRTQITPLDRGVRNARFPQMLPNGRHFLYYTTGAPHVRGVYIGDLQGAPGRRILDADGAAVYASSGHLMFLRQGTLFRQRFDLDALEPVGDPVSVANNLGVDVTVGSVALSAARAGPVVYRAGIHSGRQLTWFDRSGIEGERVGAADDTSTWGPALSPDDRTVAMTRTANGNQDVWLLDVSRQVLRRFTSHESTDLNPVWSPDGQRLAFTSSRDGVGELYVAAVSGDGPEQRLLDTPGGVQATDWSRDGRYLLFRSQNPATRYDIWALSLDGAQKPFPIVQTKFDERDAQFSPDGKWIAFESDESGRFEVYVQRFPGPGRKWPISPTGGAQVRWSRDGRELFYIAADKRLMSVPVTLDDANQRVDAGAPTPLFTTHVGAVAEVNRQQYMPAADGQRFLMNTVKDERTYPITVLLNWRGP